jgi:hypothetical protein
MDVYLYFLVKNIPCLRDSTPLTHFGRGAWVRVTPLSRLGRGAGGEGFPPSPLVGEGLGVRVISPRPPTRQCAFTDIPHP